MGFSLANVVDIRRDNRARHIELLEREVAAIERDIAQLAHRKWLKTMELNHLKEQAGG